MSVIPLLGVVGESLVDVVSSAAGDVMHPGGSPLNVAVGLARLGMATHFITQIGDDPEGDLLFSHLEGAGVRTGGVVRAGRTSRATATIDASGAATYAFDLRWALPAQSPPPVLMLHTGSIGAWLEPGAATVAEMVRARHPGTIASVDANVRPAMAGDRATIVRRLENLFRSCQIVKLSDEDAAWIFPDLAEQDVVSALLGYGARLAVLTLGARGAVLASSSARVEVTAPATMVADTIGAGDSFMAGMLAVLAASGHTADLRSDGLDPESLRAVGEFAARCAAITVSRFGADPPTATEIGGVPRPTGWQS